MNNSDQEQVVASVARIWAKTNSTTGQWHPLLHHLVETSAVASYLWDVLAPGTCKIIADALGLRLEDARLWSLFLVGAHDLGKASPSFQCKWTPCIRPLQQLSYSFPVNVTAVPHGRISSKELAKILIRRGVERKVANEIARAVGGHHGVFDTHPYFNKPHPKPLVKESGKNPGRGS